MTSMVSRRVVQSGVLALLGAGNELVDVLAGPHEQIDDQLLDDQAPRFCCLLQTLDGEVVEHDLQAFVGHAGTVARSKSPRGPGCSISRRPPRSAIRRCMI